MLGVDVSFQNQLATDLPEVAYNVCYNCTVDDFVIDVASQVDK